jgi:hypothetical protein
MVHALIVFRLLHIVIEGFLNNIIYVMIITSIRIVLEYSNLTRLGYSLLLDFMLSLGLILC